MPMRHLRFPKYLVIFFACFAFAFICGSLTFIPKSSHAEASDQADLDVNLNLTPVINLAVDKTTAAFNVTPTPFGVLGTTEVIATVNTNNATGYTLSMNSKYANCISPFFCNKLVHTDGVTLISSITNTTPGVAQSLTANTWGYNYEPGNTVSSPVTTFLEIPLPGSANNVINSSTAHVNNAHTIVTFGAFIDLNQKPGVYEQLVTFSAVTNPVPPPLPTMQEVTISNCPTTPTPLRDIRDKHYYAVQKLADGRCWMLTNLAYGGPEAGVEFTTGNGISGNTIASFDTWTTQSPPLNNQKQWVNPTNSTLNGGNVTQNGTNYCATAFRIRASSVDYTECGYFYNWCAALGNASALCNTSAANSNIANAGIGLCPTGWQLPTYSEFNAMYAALGNVPTLTYGPTSTFRGVLAGDFYPSVGLREQDTRGYLWSAVSFTLPGDAIYFYFGPTASYGNPAFTSSSTVRSTGHAVRCILSP